MSDMIKIAQAGIAQEEQDKIRVKQLSAFILDPYDLPERIDHAIGFITINNIKYRYFGIKIYENISTTNKKGDIKTIKKEVPAIVTENRLIISQYTQPDGTKFQFDNIMSLKNNRWEIKSIKDFVEGRIVDITYSQAYNNLKKNYELNMAYESKETYEFNALWDLQTYHWDLIEKALIIKLEGITGAAKSKSMKLSSNQSFNGRKWLRPNPANFFRYRNNNKATIYIEEAERLFDNSKKKQSGDDELVEYLNASYERGNFVPRQNDKDINQTDEFDPFGFTQIGAIKPLKGALEKRSITETMIRARKDDYRGNTEIPAQNDSMYAYSRALAYTASLLHYKEFVAALEIVQNDYGLTNREWLLTKPILALSHCIDAELEKRMGNYLSKCFESRDDTFDETSWQIILAKILLQRSCKEKSDCFIANHYLRMDFMNATDPNKEISQQTISKMISNDLYLGIYKKRSADGTKRGFKISFERLCDIFSRNQILNSQDIIKIVSEVSDCQYTDDKIKELCSDTILTNNYDMSEVSENILTNTKIVSEFKHESDSLTKDRGVPPSLDDLKSMLLDKPMNKKELLEKGFSQDALDKWSLQGLIYETLGTYHLFGGSA